MYTLFVAGMSCQVLHPSILDEECSPVLSHSTLLLAICLPPCSEDEARLPEPSLGLPADCLSCNTLLVHPRPPL